MCKGYIILNSLLLLFLREVRELAASQILTKKERAIRSYEYKRRSY